MVVCKCGKIIKTLGKFRSQKLEKRLTSWPLSEPFFLDFFPPFCFSCSECPLLPHARFPLILQGQAIVTSSKTSCDLSSLGYHSSSPLGRFWPLKGGWGWTTLGNVARWCFTFHRDGQVCEGHSSAAYPTSLATTGRDCGRPRAVLLTASLQAITRGHAENKWSTVFTISQGYVLISVLPLPGWSLDTS